MSYLMKCRNGRNGTQKLGILKDHILQLGKHQVELGKHHILQFAPGR